ncbi:hypothetical protein M433DRAFT_74268 [Acidomyces richmondensis BFW]|nr:MAG: hypothetical protein FE78DRAFT_155626 [Acidomyces sp. 'richmondensis']KYG42216.1 hypothetical protein M433DRAFT_74268 [Acidomyces richmondensis BFW]
MGSKVPPPLPPRQSSGITLHANDGLPSYDSISKDHRLAINGPWSAQDHRSSSTQSLLPVETGAQDERRRLLMIFIHGFMGNEMSFRSFPAHLHNLMTLLLSDSHTVHTKIYPRYRSKRNIKFARDDFSSWLEPHENANTDVVLLGHSMGGLLAAEVVLMPAPPPASRPFKHRILGTINFDVPFLGMHPGVVRSGLASIFNPPDEPDNKFSSDLIPVDSTRSGESESMASPTPSVTAAPRRSDTLWAPESPDPNFNPSFSNDVILPVRKGWRNAWHFVNKHSGELTKATKQLVSSHMEFGGAMANYNELKIRYARIRALEEDTDAVRESVPGNGQTPPRVRFINYYTASTGRPKKPKQTTNFQSSDISGSQGNVSEPPLSDSHLEAQSTDGLSGSAPSPHIAEADWATAAESLTVQDPKPLDDDPDECPTTPVPSDALSLPPLPDLPPAPPPLDTSYIQDAATRKLVEREHARATKAYEMAVKNREKALSDRAKLQGKRDRQAKKDAEKATKAAKRAEKAEMKELEAPPKKERKFCTLPPKDNAGRRDPCWVRVFMADVDEVGAHCGLFFVDERYEHLVGDVGERIQGWIVEEHGR